MLKKLDTTERRLVSENETVKTKKTFQLIYEVINLNGYKSMTKYFCELLKVSRSGYYNHLKTVNNRLEREELDLKARIIIEKAFNGRGYKKGDVQ
jgi:putative transposase